MQSDEIYYRLTLKGALYVALVENIGDQVNIDKYINPIYTKITELVNIEEEEVTHAI